MKYNAIFVCKIAIAVVLCLLVILPVGCAEMGETQAESRIRHLRNARINKETMGEDVDYLLLIDQPSKLTDKRIP